MRECPIRACLCCAQVHNVPKVMGPLLLHAFATFLAIPYLPNGWLTYPSRGAKVSGFLIFLFRTAATVVMNLVLTSPWVVVIWKLPEAAREHLEAHSYAALDGGPSPLALARGWSAAVVGFILWSIMRNENVKVAPPPPEGAPKKRVAIVGAGLAGLVTAKVSHLDASPQQSDSGTLTGRLPLPPPSPTLPPAPPPAAAALTTRASLAVAGVP